MKKKVKITFLLVMILMMGLCITVKGEDTLGYHQDGSEYCIIGKAVSLTVAQWEEIKQTNQVEETIFNILEYRIRPLYNMESSQQANHYKISLPQQVQADSLIYKGRITVFATADESDNFLEIPIFVAEKWISQADGSRIPDTDIDLDAFGKEQLLSKHQQFDSVNQAYVTAGNVINTVSVGIAGTAALAILPKLKTLRWYKGKKAAYLKKFV